MKTFSRASGNGGDLTWSGDGGMGMRGGTPERRGDGGAEDGGANINGDGGWGGGLDGDGGVFGFAGPAAGGDGP
jgi:hypothetical protein